MFICNYLLKLYKEYCRSDKKSRLLKSTEDMYILDYYGNIICLKNNIHIKYIIVFSSNNNRFLKSTENKFGNTPHVSRLNFKNLKTTSSETSNKPIIPEWEKLEITEVKYYDNIVKPITTQALEIKKEISTIL